MCFSFTDDTGNVKSDLKRLSRKLLNKSTVNRVISKQECLVMLLELDFVLCSDRFDNISVGGKQLITKSEKCAKSGTLVKSYGRRQKIEELNMSLHEYYHYKKDQYRGKKLDIW